MFAVHLASHLQAFGIIDEATWIEHAEERCTFCDRPDHWLSRCFKIFKATDLGQQYSERMKGARRKLQALVKEGAPLHMAVVMALSDTLSYDAAQEYSEWIAFECEKEGTSADEPGSVDALYTVLQSAATYNRQFELTVTATNAAKGSQH